MQEKNRKAADKFALLGLAHALDLLGDEVQIGLDDSALAQQRSLFEAPGVKVLVVA